MDVKNRPKTRTAAVITSHKSGLNEVSLPPLPLLCQPVSAAAKSIDIHGQFVRGKSANSLQ